MWNNKYEQLEQYRKIANSHPSFRATEAIDRLLMRNRYLVEEDKPKVDKNYHRDYNRKKKNITARVGNCKYCNAKFKTFDSRVNTCKAHRGMKQWDYDRTVKLENKLIKE